MHATFEWDRNKDRPILLRIIDAPQRQHIYRKRSSLCADTEGSNGLDVDNEGHFLISLVRIAAKRLSLGTDDELFMTKSHYCCLVLFNHSGYFFSTSSSPLVCYSEALPTTALILC